MPDYFCSDCDEKISEREIDWVKGARCPQCGSLLDFWEDNVNPKPSLPNRPASKPQIQMQSAVRVASSSFSPKRPNSNQGKSIEDLRTLCNQYATENQFLKRENQALRAELEMHGCIGKNAEVRQAKQGC